MNGILNVLKPPNATSFDVVSFVRRKLNIKKVGHTGTLDPMAVGVLPICVGKGTKLINYMQYDSKAYRCELSLGANTDTQDIWGEVLETFSVDSITEDRIREVFATFMGKQKQIPPMYSALKVNGKKLYELAREGKEIERNPRDIEIFKLDIINISDSKILFEAEVSKGTYIRTLCYDIGKALGCGGYMSFLERTRSGMFSLKDTITIEELIEATPEDIEERYLMPMDVPLSSMSRVNVKPYAERFLLNGVPVKEYAFENKELKLADQETVRVYLNDKFYAIGRYRKGDEEIGDIKVVTLLKS